MNIEVMSVPGIVAIVYLMISLYKQHIAKGREKYLKVIPIIACVLGIIIGSLCYIIEPNVIPAQNLVIAILIGAASGLSATGTNQIFKQLNKGKD